MHFQRIIFPDRSNVLRSPDFHRSWVHASAFIEDELRSGRERCCRTPRYRPVSSAVLQISRVRLMRSCYSNTGSLFAVIFSGVCVRVCKMLIINYITLHYQHFKRHLHLKWPVVHQQLHVIRNTAHRPSTQASYTASRVRPKRKISCAAAQIAELCRPVSSSSGRQCLRSASRGDLIVLRFRLRRSGYRAFAVSGPHVWNSLPTEIRQSCNNLLQFKSKLKTFLFQQSWALLWIHI